jgi:hypothetical protein
LRFDILSAFRYSNLRLTAGMFGLAVHAMFIYEN